MNEKTDKSKLSYPFYRNKPIKKEDKEEELDSKPTSPPKYGVFNRFK